METDTGDVPGIAIMKMLRMDEFDPINPTTYHWLVEITPDQNHPLIKDHTGNGKWRVQLQFSRLLNNTHQDRYMLAYRQAEQAWINYWNPIKNIEPVNDNFILDGAL